MTKTLTIRFATDLRKAEADIDRMQKKVNALSGVKTPGGPKIPGVPSLPGKSSGDGLKGIFDQVSDGASTLGGNGAGSLAGLASKFMGLSGPVAVVAAGLGGLAMGLNKTISAGMAAEDAITKLEVLFQDRGKALETYKKSIDFSNVTPFDPADVVPAAVIAGQYGADGFKKGLYGMKGDAMTLIGDMASFSGQSMEEAATALFRGDLQLLDKYGKAGRDAYTAAQQAGQIGSQAFREAFVKNMSQVQLWAGMAEKRSKTISGMWSTIVGNVNTAWLYISGAAEGDKATTFWSQIHGIVEDITDWSGQILDYLKPLLVEGGAAVGSMFRGWWETLKAFFTLIGPQLKAIFGAVTFAIKGWFTALKWFWGLVINVMQTIQYVAKVFFGWAQQVYSFFDKIFGINKMLTGLSEWFSGIVLKILLVGDMIKLFFEVIWSKIKDSFENLPTIMIDKVMQFWNWFKTSEFYQYTAAVGRIAGNSLGLSAVTATVSGVQRNISMITGGPDRSEPARNETTVSNTRSTTNNTVIYNNIVQPSRGRDTARMGDLSGAFN